MTSPPGTPVGTQVNYDRSHPAPLEALTGDEFNTAFKQAQLALKEIKDAQEMLRQDPNSKAGAAMLDEGHNVQYTISRSLDREVADYLDFSAVPKDPSNVPPRPRPKQR